MSYANMILYSSVLPGYDDVKEGDQEQTIDADDPANQQRIQELLYE